MLAVLNKFETWNTRRSNLMSLLASSRKEHLTSIVNNTRPNNYSC